MIKKCFSVQRPMNPAAANIEAVVGCQIALGAVRLRNETLLVETFCRSDHGAVGITNSHSPHVDGNPVPLLMPKVNLTLTRLSFVQSTGNRATDTALHAVMVVAMRKNILAAESSQRFVPQVPGYLLGALIPE